MADSVRSAVAAAGNGIRGIFGSDRTLSEIEAASQIQAAIHLTYDGRSSSELVPIILGQIGEAIVDADEQFKIVTSDDVVITREKLILKREVNVEGDEDALVPESAFSAIRGAMSEWRLSGMFEQ